jgi:alcohol dehydrogenase class IV
MVADALGLGGKTDEEKLDRLIAAIDELKAKIGIKATIRDYGVDEKCFLDGWRNGRAGLRRPVQPAPTPAPADCGNQTVCTLPPTTAKRNKEGGTRYETG